MIGCVFGTICANCQFLCNGPSQSLKRKCKFDQDCPWHAVQRVGQVEWHNCDLQSSGHGARDKDLLKTLGGGGASGMGGVLMLAGSLAY